MVDNSYVLITLVENYLIISKGTLGVVFVNFSKAYGLVNRKSKKMLMIGTKIAGVHREMLSILKVMHKSVNGC